MADLDARIEGHRKAVAAWEDRLARYLRSDFKDDEVYRFILSRLDRAQQALRRVSQSASHAR